MPIDKPTDWKRRSIDHSFFFEGKPRGLKAYCLAFDLQPQDFAGKYILDLGTNEEANFAQEIGRKAKVVSLSPDFSFQDIRSRAKSSHGKLKSTAAVGQLLPFNDSTFHYVLSLHMLEHIQGIELLRNIVIEVGRVLQRKGVAMLAPWNPYDGDIFGLLTQDVEFMRKLESAQLTLECQTVSSKYREAQAYDPQTGMGLGYRVPYLRIVIKKK